MPTNKPARPAISKRTNAEPDTALVEALGGESRYLQLQIIVIVCGAVWTSLWQHRIAYKPMVNRLIRLTGLSPKRTSAITGLLNPRQMADLAIADPLTFHAFVATGLRLLDTLITRDMHAHMRKGDPATGEETLPWDDCCARAREVGGALLTYLEAYDPDAPEKPVTPPAKAAEPETESAIETSGPASTEPVESSGWSTPMALTIPGTQLRELRQQIEEIIHEGLAEAARPSAPPPAVSGWQPPRQPPFLRFSFKTAQVATLRTLMLVPGSVAPLVPHPFAQQLAGLSGFQPLARIEHLRNRLEALRPNEPIQLSLGEVVTIFQAIQTGALLLMREGTARPAFVKALLDQLQAPADDADERQQADGAEILHLLTHEATFEQFRRDVAALAESFNASAHNTYTHVTEVRQAREAAALLARLR